MRLATFAGGFVGVGNEAWVAGEEGLECRTRAGGVLVNAGCTGVEGKSWYWYLGVVLVLVPGEIGGVDTESSTQVAPGVASLKVGLSEIEAGVDVGVEGTVNASGGAASCCCLGRTRSSSSRARRWYSCHSWARLMRSDVSCVAIPSSGTDMAAKCEV